jgi:hypothetical protein
MALHSAAGTRLLAVMFYSEAMHQPSMRQIEKRCKVREQGNTEHFELNECIFIANMDAPASEDSLDPGEIGSIIEDENMDVLAQKTS